jgi:hypothetical protein
VLVILNLSCQSFDLVWKSIYRNLFRGDVFLEEVITIAMAVVIAVAFTACSKKTADDGHESHDEGNATFMHIHGLGYSSDGKRLFIPVHNGLKVHADGKWSDAPGEKHDYMGFSIADNGFYSSGHPAVGSCSKFRAKFENEAGGVVLQSR